MSGSDPSRAVAADAYGQIVAAMQESARGRWFLAEFAERARAQDTGVLLDAVRRLEGVVGEAATADRHGLSGPTVAALSGLIARAKADVAALSETPEAVAPAGGVVPGGVGAVGVVGVAEELQDLAWAFRECGAAPETCDALDRQARALYAAVAGQDLALRRTRRIVRLVQDLEDRLRGIAGGSGLAFEAGPAWPTTLVGSEDAGAADDAPAGAGDPPAP